MAVLIEYTHRGEYMSPLEFYDIENFYNHFIEDLRTEEFKYSRYFNKFDTRTKSAFEEVFLHNHDIILSSVRKKNEIYTLTVVDIKKMFIFQFARIFARKALHQLQVQKIGNKLKIIHIK